MLDDAIVSESILTVGTAIKSSCYSHLAIHKKNQRIDIKRNEKLYFFESGKINFFRIHDDVLTISMRAHCIAGIAQMLFQSQSHYIRCSEESRAWVIVIKDALKLFTEYNLWMHIYRILANQTQQYFSRELLVLQKSSKDIILKHLSFIWDMPENERKSVSIYSYILDRNFISRSNIHKTITELETNDIIRTAKGKLIFFNEKLIFNY